MPDFETERDREAEIAVAAYLRPLVPFAVTLTPQHFHWDLVLHDPGTRGWEGVRALIEVKRRYRWWGYLCRQTRDLGDGLFESVQKVDAIRDKAERYGIPCFWCVVPNDGIKDGDGTLNGMQPQATRLSPGAQYRRKEDGGRKVMRWHADRKPVYYFEPRTFDGLSRALASAGLTGSPGGILR